MQDYQAITPNFSVSGILASGDIARLKSMGFKTIISNLPDEEVQNGFFASHAKLEAQAAGMNYIHMPANGMTVTDAHIIEQFAEILNTADQPVLAHCKTGTRSAILFGLVSASHTPPNEVLKQLDDAGFDLDFLEEEFEEQWQLAGEKAQFNLPAAA